MATHRVSRVTGLSAPRSEEPLTHILVITPMTVSERRGARSRAHAQCGEVSAHRRCALPEQRTQSHQPLVLLPTSRRSVCPDGDRAIPEQGHRSSVGYDLVGRGNSR